MGSRALARLSLFLIVPFTAGVAALLYSLNPNFTPVQVEDFIFSTCQELGAPNEDNVYGHGRVDAGAAVAKAKNFLALHKARGDFSGDGKADLLFRHPSSGNVVLWLIP